MLGRWLTIALMPCCLPAEIARAQEPAPRMPAMHARTGMRGPLLGALLGYSSLDIEGGGAGAGDVVAPSLGFRAGWSARRFSIFLSGDAGAVETDPPGGSGMTNVDLVGRFDAMAGARPWWPYLETGVGRQWAKRQGFAHPSTGARGELRASGPVAFVGAGVQWVFNRSHTVDVGLRYGRGGLGSARFDQVRDDSIELESSSLRLQVGSAWYPAARRGSR
jgi:hypothetical protein